MKSTLEKTTKKTITILVLLCMTATLLPGETLPDAPSVVMVKNSSTFVESPTPNVVADPKPGRVPWSAERHKARWLLISLGIGALIGTAIALPMKNVHCPAVMYEGHRYDGTSPGCPKGEGPEPGKR